MKRVLATAVALVVVVAMAGPAWSHEEIDPANVLTGRPAFLTLSAANEAKADLTKLTLNAPDNLAFGSTTREPAGWTVDRSDRVITWTGGAVRPDRFDQWGFEIEGADQPGTATYRLIMSFADGTENTVDLPITVTADTGGARGAVGSTKPSSTPDGGGRANAALALSLVALVVAGTALALAVARRRGSPGPTSDGGTGTAARDAQDW